MVKLPALLLLLLCMTVPAAAGGTLVFGYGGTSLSLQSLAVLKKAYARLGFEAKGEYLPSVRSLVMADDGHLDGEVNRIESIGREYPHLLRVEVPVNHIEGIALTCNRTVTADRDALNRLRVGLKRGNRYAEEFTRGMESVVRLDDENKLVQLLKAGRLDVIVVDRTWAETLGRDKRNGCLRINEPPLVSVPLYHYLHRSRSRLLPEITRVLNEMAKSGEMASIRRRAATARTHR